MLKQSWRGKRCSIHLENNTKQYNKQEKSIYIKYKRQKQE
jgi:hypothetical protein